MNLLAAAVWTARAARGSRGRSVFLAACLALGVGAVVASQALGSALREGLAAHARRLLAADLVVSSYRDLPDGLDAYLHGYPGVRRTGVLQLAAMASSGTSSEEGARSQLVEVKVIDGEYPLRGVLELEPDLRLDQLLDAQTAVVAPELGATLGARLGAEIVLGEARFRVAGIVHDEPDRVGFSLSLGPRVFLSPEGVARAGLLSGKSRVKRCALFRLPGVADGELDELEDRIREGLSGAEALSIQTPRDSRRGLRRAFLRVERFLALAALGALVLGGIGVAQVVRAFLGERMTEIALLRVLGMRPREVAGLYLGQILLLSSAGSLVGGAAGLGVALFAGRLAPDLVTSPLALLWQPAALARGVLLGCAIAGLFSLPPLAAVWGVAPGRILASDVEPLPPPRAVRVGAAAALVAGVFACALVLGDSAAAAAWFCAGFLVLLLTLAAAGRGLVLLARRLTAVRASPYLVHGAAALARPGSGTPAALAALGLGLAVVGGLDRVDARLAGGLGELAPEDAPTVFLLDVQTDQVAEVRAVLEGGGALGLESVPVVMARLARIDGTSVEDLVAERRQGRGSRWVLTREQRLTYLADPPETNRLTAGEWWRADGVDGISVEEEFADDLGVGLGSELVFDVQGVPLAFTVTSLREVEWASFAINFFLVAEPGPLDAAPQFHLASARLEDPAAEDRVQAELASRFPNITVLRIRSIAERLLTLLSALALGVRVVGGVLVAAGFLALAGSVAASALRRRKEAALWKALGVTRVGVLALFAVEHALLGALAGLLGSAGAAALAWGFLEGWLEIGAGLSPGLVPVLMAVGAALSVLFGLLASARALAAGPLLTLRG